MVEEDGTVVEEEAPVDVDEPAVVLLDEGITVEDVLTLPGVPEVLVTPPPPQAAVQSSAANSTATVAPSPPRTPRPRTADKDAVKAMWRHLHTESESNPAHFMTGMFPKGAPSYSWTQPLVDLRWRAALTTCPDELP